MTAGISLIAGKTGAHRAPLQSDSTGKCTKGVVMGRKVWALGGAGAVVVMIIVALVEQRAAAQAGRSQVPQFEPEPLWSQALPNKWVNGQVGGVAVDSHDNVWVFHRPATIPDGEKGASLSPPQSECCIPAPPLLEFDTNGKFLQAWGGPGQGYEWFSSEHAVFVDYKDNVWLSGNAKEDNQLLKFTNKGKFLMQIGHAGKNRGSNDTENLGGPAGLFVYRKTNELFVADGYFNHRVIVFDADTGAYKRHWGAYGKKPDDNLKFPPRAQLIQGPPPEGFNNPVHAVVVTNDDMVYVADRTNNRLQVFKLDGTFIKEVFISRNTLQNEGTVHAFAVSPDKDQKFLYIVDGSNKAIRVMNRQMLEMVASVGGHAGHNAREFFHIHGVAIDSKGNLFLGEVNNGQRYYKYAFKGMGPAPAIASAR
jgi:DNA-binding beta-propeller fold protein YncE